MPMQVHVQGNTMVYDAHVVYVQGNTWVDDTHVVNWSSV